MSDDKRSKIGCERCGYVIFEVSEVPSIADPRYATRTYTCARCGNFEQVRIRREPNERTP